MKKNFSPSKYIFSSLYIGKNKKRKQGDHPCDDLPIFYLGVIGIFESETEAFGKALGRPSPRLPAFDVPDQRPAVSYHRRLILQRRAS